MIELNYTTKVSPVIGLILTLKPWNHGDYSQIQRWNRHKGPKMLDYHHSIPVPCKTEKFEGYLRFTVEKSYWKAMGLSPLMLVALRVAISNHLNHAQSCPRHVDSTSLGVALGICAATERWAWQALEMTKKIPMVFSERTYCFSYIKYP